MIIIQEYLPNPIGRDQDGEYILIQNTGTAPTSLRGWALEDASGKRAVLSETLTAGGTLRVPYERSKISLNNSGETVILRNASGAEIDRLSHTGGIGEGVVVMRDTSALFEELPRYEGQLALGRVTASGSDLFLFLFATATILSILSFACIILLKRHEENHYDHQYAGDEEARG